VGCEAFVAKKFQAKTLELIVRMNAILDDYTARGFVLTLRQLFYQLVVWTIVDNLQSEYKPVGSIVDDARLAGLIDWEAIEDRTRYLRKLPWWEGHRRSMLTKASENWSLVDNFIEWDRGPKCALWRREAL
jgi:hypothetical protein